MAFYLQDSLITSNCFGVCFAYTRRVYIERRKLRSFARSKLDLTLSITPPHHSRRTGCSDSFFPHSCIVLFSPRCYCWQLFYLKNGQSWNVRQSLNRNVQTFYATRWFCRIVVGFGTNTNTNTNNNICSFCFHYVVSVVFFFSLSL